MGLAFELEGFLKDINPYSAIPEDEKNRLDIELDRLLLKRGLSRELVRQVLRYCTQDAAFREQFMTHDLTDFIRKNWQKMSYAFHLSRHQTDYSQGSGKPVYKSLTCIDVDMIRKNDLPLTRAKELVRHARVMIKTCGKEAELLYQHVIDLVDRKDYFPVSQEDANDQTQSKPARSKKPLSGDSLSNEEPPF